VIVDQASQLPMVRFDGLDDWLDVVPSKDAFAGGLTLVLVMRHLDAGGPYLDVENDDAEARVSFQYHPTSGVALRERPTGSAESFGFWTSVADLGALEVVTLVVEGGSATVYKDGVADPDENPRSLAPLEPTPRKHGFVGRDLTGNNFTGFDLGELVLYGRPLAAAERGAVEAALLAKWRACPAPAAFATDPLHCGTCGHRCSAGETCSEGKCVATGAEIACPDRLALDGAAVKVCTGRADWTRAREHCRAHYGELFAPSSPAEQAALQAAVGVSAYVGVTDLGTQGTFTAPDGRPHTYQPWGDGQPAPAAGARCAFTTKTSGWEAVDCAQEVAAQWACADRATVTCYPRFLGGKRYEPCQSWIGATTFEDRRALCAARGATIAHVADAQENARVKQLVGAFDLTYIDASDAKVEGVFLDGAGKPIAYAPWHGGSPATANNSEANDCVGVDGNGEWWASDCAVALVTTLCVYDGKAEPTCDGLVSPNEPYTAPDFLVTDGSVNGGGNTAILAPGKPFTYDYTFTLDPAVCPGCVTQVLTGYFPGPQAMQCDYNAVPGAKVVKKTIHDALVAPTIPGVYDLRSVVTQMATCGTSFGPFAHRGTGARICVL
jgi:hypothetical protein